ncbi:MAG TPA: hypothetical protein VFB34_03575 [Chloroflexota bacterium]|nr:hypothetical protein [Chloroflexota bacterium]
MSGGQKTTRVSGLNGRPISRDAPVEGQVLGFDGTRWTPFNTNNPLQVATLKW